jgi:hypothetical protein
MPEPWDPKFDLLPVTAFIPNLKAIFERDFARALAYYGGAALRGLQAINTARQVAPQWPVLNLLPAGNDPAMNEDGALLDEKPRLLCEWETASRVANSLATDLVTYVTAGRSVLYEMTVADVTGLDTEIPQGSRAGLYWDVSTERYSERYYEAEKLFTMVGSVVLTINYSEGKKRNG